MLHKPYFVDFSILDICLFERPSASEKEKENTTVVEQSKKNKDFQSSRAFIQKEKFENSVQRSYIAFEKTYTGSA